MALALIVAQQPLVASSAFLWVSVGYQTSYPSLLINWEWPDKVSGLFPTDQFGWKGWCILTLGKDGAPVQEWISHNLQSSEKKETYCRQVLHGESLVEAGHTGDDSNRVRNWWLGKVWCTWASHVACTRVWTWSSKWGFAITVHTQSAQKIFFTLFHPLSPVPSYYRVSSRIWYENSNTVPSQKRAYGRCTLY